MSVSSLQTGTVAAARQPDNISVLLVEDNPADARLLREAVREVEGSPIQLTHVDTLGRALSRLEQEQFDLVMLDLSLPDAEGLETLVRAHNKAPSVPIVVLTGLDDEALAVRAVREGAQDYLVKGQVTGHLLVRAMRYATERKRAVEALQRSEEYFRSLIENAMDLITVLDPDGHVRYGSPSFDRTLGHEHGTLAGSSIFDLLHPDDVRRVQEVLENGSQQPGSTHSFECRFRHRNGQWRWFESIGKRFEAESSVNGYVLNSRDVSERKLAEDELLQANERLRAVFEASPLAIYMLDSEGSVRSWNTAAEIMFGYSASEVLNNPLPIIFQEDGTAFLDRLHQTRSGQLAAGLEQRAKRKDGTAIEVSVWNSLMRDVSGAVTGVVEAVADNTERKRLEEQFRQVQKMEAVGRLAGGVAHDFNNLLTVITGYAQMLLEQLGPSNPISEDIEQVMKAADRATSLTRQLLAFSRKQMVQPKVMDPDALIGDMAPMLRRLIGENVRLQFGTRAGGARIRVDPGNLEQVIVNLIVNGRDAISGEGTVDLSTRTVRIEATTGGQYITFSPGDYYVLEVSDTGSGMDDETMSHLFEPFFTTKAKGQGTGLGLSTSYGIIKQNRGEILVRSNLGEGSTFSVYLPIVVDAIDAIPAKTASDDAWLGTESLLIAEDEDGVRTVVTEMLRKRGYSVRTAPDGAGALEIAAGMDKIDMLITDIVMPGMSGRELADKLRTSRPGLPVLFVSGYAESGIVHEGGVIEADTAFLHKPFTPEDLARKVRQVLAATATAKADGPLDTPNDSV